MLGRVGNDSFEEEADASVLTDSPEVLRRWLLLVVSRRRIDARGIFASWWQGGEEVERCGVSRHTIRGSRQMGERGETMAIPAAVAIWYAVK